ncbi:hypothetical protein HDU82_007936 [Entophlyctis luteolus]|nr:hypothetical protein HDU82_007936 [Entophlyctis luteolus]
MQITPNVRSSSLLVALGVVSTGLHLLCPNAAPSGVKGFPLSVHGTTSKVAAVFGTPSPVSAVTLSQTTMYASAEMSIFASPLTASEFGATSAVGEFQILTEYDSPLVVVAPQTVQVRVPKYNNPSLQIPFHQVDVIFTSHQDSRLRLLVCQAFAHERTVLCSRVIPYSVGVDSNMQGSDWIVGISASIVDSVEDKRPISSFLIKVCVVFSRGSVSIIFLRWTPSISNMGTLSMGQLDVCECIAPPILHFTRDEVVAVSARGTTLQQAGRGKGSEFGPKRSSSVISVPLRILRARVFDSVMQSARGDNGFGSAFAWDTSPYTGAWSGGTDDVRVSKKTKSWEDSAPLSAAITETHSAGAGDSRFENNTSNEVAATVDEDGEDGEIVE